MSSPNLSGRLMLSEKKFFVYLFGSLRGQNVTYGRFLVGVSLMKQTSRGAVLKLRRFYRPSPLGAPGNKPLIR